MCTSSRSSRTRAVCWTTDGDLRVGSRRSSSSLSSSGRWAGPETPLMTTNQRAGDTSVAVYHGNSTNTFYCWVTSVTRGSVEPPRLPHCSQPDRTGSELIPSKPEPSFISGSNTLELRNMELQLTWARTRTALFLRLLGCRETPSEVPMMVLLGRVSRVLRT